MIEVKEAGRNFIRIFFATVITTLTGLITGFLIPGFYDTDNYALYKVFTLYLGYVGLFHFGFSDGFLVRFGAYDYDMFPKEKMRGLFRFFAFWNIAISAIVATIIAITVGGFKRKLCLLFVSLNITFVNFNNLFSFLNQCIKDFKFDSIIKNIQSIIMLGLSALIILLKLDSYVYYVAFISAVYALISFLQAIKYREFIFGESDKWASIWPLIKDFVSVGFIIMISQLMGEIILGFDRLLIDNAMSVEEFAVYSFAVSIVSIIYGIVNGVSRIVYPYLARSTPEERKSYFPKLLFFLTVLIGISLNGYYVVKIIIQSLLPKYTSSIPVLIYLFPTILFKVLISVVGSNYFKILGMEKSFILTNVIALVVSVALDIVACFVFKDIIYIALASLVSFVIWYAVTNIFISANMKIKLLDSIKLIFAPILIVAAMILLSSVSWWGILIFNGLLILLVILCFYKELKWLLQAASRHAHRKKAIQAESLGGAEQEERNADSSENIDLNSNEITDSSDDSINKSIENEETNTNINK